MQEVLLPRRVNDGVSGQGDRSQEGLSKKLRSVCRSPVSQGKRGLKAGNASGERGSLDTGSGAIGGDTAAGMDERLDTVFLSVPGNH